MTFIARPFGPSYAGSCLADPEPENPVCDAAEKKADHIDRLFSELITACKDAAATEPDFRVQFDKLGDALDDTRDDWLYGDVYAEIRNLRESR